METKRCSCCGEVKPVTEFYKRTASKDGLDSKCKSCHKAYHQSPQGKAVRAKAKAKYRQSEKYRATQTKYQKSTEGQAAYARAKQRFETKIPPAIYQIKCLENKRVYIGSSITPNRRRSDHWKCLKGGRHENPSLQADYDRYGREAFTFEIVEDCSHLSEPELRALEQRYIDQGENLYNLKT